MKSIASLLGTSQSEDAKKQWAWNNATPIAGFPDYRIDCDGKQIKWSDYGKYSEFGWQIDHIQPQALGGGDHPSNLRARHSKGNASAGGLLGSLFNTSGSFLK